MRIGFIGFGKMGSALASSLKKSGEKTVIFDRNKEALAKAKQDGFEAADSASETAKKSGIIFVCVKPQDLGETLSEIKSDAKGKIVVSIAAGKKISSMKSVLGEAKIVRVMPNINALAGASMNVFTSQNLNSAEKKIIKSLLEKCGSAVEMPEEKFDAVTALSGSGPAFAAYFIDCLAEAGEKNGLSGKDSRELALNTVLGTAKLLKENNMRPIEVVEMVSSPNGTTVAGRKFLESGEFKKIISETVTAARKRSEELGR
ncbi:MAG: pyrroline-5-carboxylate reductase [archaeon]